MLCSRKCSIAIPHNFQKISIVVQPAVFAQHFSFNLQFSLNNLNLQFSLNSPSSLYHKGLRCHSNLDKPSGSCSGSGAEDALARTGFHKGGRVPLGVPGGEEPEGARQARLRRAPVRSNLPWSSASSDR